MGDKFTEGLFMSFIDDAERIILGDTVGDDVPLVSYTIREKSSPKPQQRETPLDALYNEASSCHACTGYESRSIFVRPIVKKEPKVLFIAPYPEGSVIFSPESLKIFRAWWKLSLLLEEGEWALTTLVKCPVPGFDRTFCDACRSILRTEMAEISPEAMILLGHDTASYMLGKNENMDTLRQKRFVVNHIPVFVTYSPRDYIQDPSLKKAIWSDMLFIRRQIGTEDRSS